MIPRQKVDPQPFLNGQLSLEVFDLIRKEYRERYGYTIVYSDLDGNLIYGLPNCDKFPCQESCRLARRQAIEMGLNYGSPLPTRCPSTFLFWSLPICLNNTVLGGLVTLGVKEELSWSSPNRSLRNLDRAQEGLAEIAEKYNVTNTAFLQQRRRVVRKNSSHFSHASTPRIPNLQELWRKESKAFFDGLRDSDRTGVIKRLNHVIQLLAKADSEALAEAKGFALELIATTVEVSANGTRDRNFFFKFHYETAEKIVLCKTLEEICESTRDALECFLQAVDNPRIKAKHQTVQKVLTHIEENLEKTLNRDQVAKRVGISPSRLSHLLKEETGESFSDIVKRYRMEQARDILLSSDKSISNVALQTGYCDQSHFTKVFQKYFSVSPMEYRRKHMLK